MFCDDHYHPGQVPIEGVKPLQEKGYQIDVCSDATGFCVDSLSDYNVIIMSKCDNTSSKDTTSWKNEAVQHAIIKFVEDGGGLLVTHNGTVAGKNTQALDMLIGCRFGNHPDMGKVTFGVVKSHPVTKSVELFCEEDEHYRLEILCDDVDVLAASYQPAKGDAAKYDTEPYFNYPHCIAPSAYVRTQGRGRVCVLTPGHTVIVWYNENFQKLLENALIWCGGN